MLTTLRRALSRVPLAVRLKEFVDYKFGIGLKVAMKSGAEMEYIDRRLFVDKMRQYWKNELHVSDRTIYDWLKTALNFDRYLYDVQEIKRRFGSLQGKKIADIGCGWGSFLLVLSKEGAEFHACDIARAHVEVTQMRVPSAQVIQSDARNLEAFPTGSFDLVLEHDVFEHIGNTRGDTGPIARTYQDKLQNLKELKRILKKGGQGFISTGNYQFPFNGEVQLWFVHWMPFEHQTRYLKSVNIDSDRYWLCTWSEVQTLFKDAGLQIDEVFTPPHGVQFFLSKIMHILRHERHVNEEFKKVLGELMLKKPEFMPSWMIFFSKP